MAERKYAEDALERELSVWVVMGQVYRDGRGKAFDRRERGGFAENAEIWIGVPHPFALFAKGWGS